VENERPKEDPPGKGSFGYASGHRPGGFNRRESSANQGASKNNQLRVEAFLVGRDSRQARKCQEAQHKKSK